MPFIKQGKLVNLKQKRKKETDTGIKHFHFVHYHAIIRICPLPICVLAREFELICKRESERVVSVRQKACGTGRCRNARSFVKINNSYPRVKQAEFKKIHIIRVAVRGIFCPRNEMLLHG